MNKVDKDIFPILCDNVIKNKLPDDVCYSIYDYLFCDKLITNHNVYVTYETYQYEKYYEEKYKNQYFKNKYLTTTITQLIKSIIICLIHKKTINFYAMIPYLKNDINYFIDHNAYNDIYDDLKFNHRLFYIQLYTIIKEFVINNNVKNGTCIYNITYMNKVERVNDKINEFMNQCSYRTISFL